MSTLLRHKSLLIRFLSLLGLGGVIFLAFWILSYYLLPEGVLRGRTAAAVLAGEEAASSLLLEFLRIVLLNTFMMVVIVMANRILIIKGFPLGYFPPLVLSAIYAVTLGTNSFSMPLPARMAPSLGVLLRSGPYEITSYLLMAASTYALPTYTFVNLIPPESEAIQPSPRFMENVSWPGFALAVLLMVGANLWEAYQIISY
jgi:hypothetical protein